MAIPGAEPAAKKQKKGFLDSLIDAAFNVGSAVVAPFTKPAKVKLKEVKLDLPELKLDLVNILKLDLLTPSFNKPDLLALLRSKKDEDEIKAKNFKNLFSTLPQNFAQYHCDKTAFFPKIHPSYPNLILSKIPVLAQAIKVSAQNDNLNNEFYGYVLDQISELITLIKTCSLLDAKDKDGNSFYKNIFLLYDKQLRCRPNRQYDGRHYYIMERLEKILYLLIALGAHLDLPEYGTVLEQTLSNHVQNHNRLIGLLTAKIHNESGDRFPLSLTCKIGEFLLFKDRVVDFRSGAKAAFLPKRENCLTYQEEDTSMNLDAKKAK